MKDQKSRADLLVGMFAATIFLSALLLFQVQPLISRFILPWFGSTPGVWATALLFFQIMLLLGYAYSHFLVRYLDWSRQALVHGALLCLALFTLPIFPDEALKPVDSEAPIGRILGILGLTVGIPFLLLSTTAPLLQRWYALLRPGPSPYRLYALSNAGSLLALLSYPFLVEPWLRLQTQVWFWSGSYLLFAGLCVACAWQLHRQAQTKEAGPPLPSMKSEARVGEDDQRPSAGKVLLWLALSACGSGLLLAATNQMTLDIAVVPFLWIVPLSLYLLSFILCFESERWYLRPLFSLLLALALINTLRLLYHGVDLEIHDQVAGYCLMLFVCCMCCHGELARLRPPPEQLTFFFLIVSLGGAMGGLFVALLAPLLFRGFYEFHILLAVTAVLVVVVQLPGLKDTATVLGRLRPDRLSLGTGLVAACRLLTFLAVAVVSVLLLLSSTWFESGSRNRINAFANWQLAMFWAGPFLAAALLLAMDYWRRLQRESLAAWWASGPGAIRALACVVLGLGLFAFSGSLVWIVVESERRVVDQARNFYGVLSLKEWDIGNSDHALSLSHGRIRHGEQLQRYRDWPTSYYGPETGAGLAIQRHPARWDYSREFRIGLVGLGAGTLAGYANAYIDTDADDRDYASVQDQSKPDYVAYYEINPLVTDWAQTHFTFIADARARGAVVEIFEGDARITLERQLQRGGQNFDVLAIDAFSSDAIPIHLLTLESLEVYLGHLREDGVLALHITNRYVDLLPVVARLARELGKEAIYVENYADSHHMVSSSDWVLLSNNREFLDKPAVREDEEPMPATGPLWTDDFSSLFQILEFD